MTPVEYSDMILCREIRECASCKEPTYWMRRRQRNLGYCIDHARRPDITEHEALSAILRAFPGLTAGRVAPKRWHRGEYPRWVRLKVTYRGVPGAVYRWGLPLDAGPCRSCGFLVQLYGADGYPYCIECDQERGQG